MKVKELLLTQFLFKESGEPDITSQSAGLLGLGEKRAVPRPG